MDLSKHHSKHRNVPFHTVCQPSFFLLIYCKLARSEGEGQIYAKLLCDLVTPLFIILCKSMRTVSELNEFEPRFKSAKNRFKFAGLNLEILNTILSETYHI